MGKIVRRLPDDGNLMWKLYRELGDTPRAELLAVLQDAGIPHSTFLRQTHADRLLCTLEYRHLRVYREFFLIHGVDLFHEANQEQAIDTQDLLVRAGLAMVDQPAPTSKRRRS